MQRQDEKHVSKTLPRDLSKFKGTRMKAISEWTGGRLFGQYKGHRKLANGIQILSHTGGFAVFLPPDVFHNFDIKTPIHHSPHPDKACWIAGMGYGFVKVDVLPQSHQELKKYIDADTNKALAEIEKFVKNNFIENTPRLYPTDGRFTHGSFIKKPNIERPFRALETDQDRIRDYHIKF